MAISARERLARLLGGSDPGGSFAARMNAPADALRLDVEGVGPVALPLRAPRTKKLIEVARPAKFGRGEETLSDPGVRDTWEIAPDRFELGGTGWVPMLDAALEYFRDELGLPAKTRLRAEPHALLVYGKGQFFLPHQDSEKDDAMVGTLVVSLPSAHTGGELVVEHGGESRVYQASKERLTFVAFYADCRHEVKPVKSGYRVTLTFNLLAEAEDEDASGDVGPVADLAVCLTEHFAEPALPRWGGRELPPPNRLVYLLDHEYTQRGLSWSRLKGADAERAALLRAAAARAGCEAMLALAEVKETWDAYPPGGGDPWDRDYYDDSYDEEDEEDLAPGTGSGAHDDYADYELNDLIDDEITLGWWTRPGGGGGEAICLPVSYEERCASTPNKNLEPFRSEYEGYMGNYGNTLDRWYRRSAVLLWPRERAFAARAEAGSEGALAELRDRIAAGELDRVRADAASLASFWPQTAPRAEALGTALEVAAGLGVPGTAAMLLEPFHAEALTPDHADALAAVAGAYGREWTRELVGGWFPAQRVWRVSGADRGEWVQGLPQLCDALRAAGDSYTARLLADAAWRWLEEELGLWCARARAEERGPRLAELGLPLACVWQAAEDERRAAIAQALRGYPDTVLECVVPALRAAAKLPAQVRGAAGVALLARDCVGRLEAFLATPQRAEGDWSIAWAGCGAGRGLVAGRGRTHAGGCELCDTLAAFLASSTERVREWPLAKDGRRHVHSAIDLAGLPVSHSTRRQGRPYTLVLTKTDALFTRERQTRRTAGTDLTWLKATWA
ncbi:2OG-Fe(II) oxygenase [Streptomyces sp. NPDC005774]|uniref:2OG-Fe(II) oxygenase n=1 Tax=Streptomyces sp. NPDC005774 TaxID=3364728 RepID=UPI0036843A31